MKLKGGVLTILHYHEGGYLADKLFSLQKAGKLWSGEGQPNRPPTGVGEPIKKTETTL